MKGHAFKVLPRLAAIASTFSPRLRSAFVDQSILHIDAFNTVAPTCKLNAYVETSRRTHVKNATGLVTARKPVVTQRDLKSSIVEALARQYYELRPALEQSQVKRFPPVDGKTALLRDDWVRELSRLRQARPQDAQRSLPASVLSQLPDQQGWDPRTMQWPPSKTFPAGLRDSDIAPKKAADDALQKLLSGETPPAPPSEYDQGILAARQSFYRDNMYQSRFSAAVAARDAAAQAALGAAAAAAGAGQGAPAAGGRPRRAPAGKRPHPRASILPSDGQHGNGLHAAQRREGAAAAVELASEKATKRRRQEDGSLAAGRRRHAVGAAGAAAARAAADGRGECGDNLMPTRALPPRAGGACDAFPSAV
jgi:hypothetical protein